MRILVHSNTNLHGSEEATKDYRSDNARYKATDYRMERCIIKTGANLGIHIDQSQRIAKNF
jgi:hypothetical protein